MLILGEYGQHFLISSSPYLLSYATYVAATILVRTPPLAGDGGMEGDRLLKICLEVLDEHCHLYAAARRTKSAIDVLMRHVRSNERVPVVSPAQASTHVHPQRPPHHGPPSFNENSTPDQARVHLGNENMDQGMSSTWPSFLDASERGFFQDADREAVLRSFAMDSLDGTSALDGFGVDPRLQGGLDFTLGLHNIDLGSFSDLFA